MSTFDLILTAAGNSTRFNSGSSTPVKKECAIVDGRSVLSSALMPFLSFTELRNIVITYPDGGYDTIRSALEETVIPEGKTICFVQGGRNRTQSVRNAVLHLKEKNTSSDFIAVHDGARPFITRSLIENILHDAEKYGSAAPGLKLTDAVRATDGTFITSPLDRDSLIRIQTPQIFERKRFIAIYSSMNESDSYQDDTEPYILSGERCFITAGDDRNTKITYKRDVERNEMRIGFGNDIHRLVEGRKLYIGGVIIPSSVGEEAHSDGDVLIHAVIDAVLGAEAKGDIGHFFPPEDDRWKDADSRELLRVILDEVKPEIINLDSTVTLEKVKLSPYILSIRESLASLLGVDISRVSVKAKTNEGLDSIGCGNAVKAEAVILLR